MKSIYFTKILLLLLLLNSCKEDCTNTLSGIYNHTIPVGISPALSEFSVGDTIYIRSRFREDSVVEYTSKLVFTLPNHKFLPRATMNRISDSPAVADAFQYFDVIIDTTKYNYKLQNYTNGAGKNGLELIGEYTYQNKIYDLVYKLVPKQPGIYVLRQGSLYMYKIDEQNFVQKCRKGYSYIYTFMNGFNKDQKDTISNNFQFVKLSKDPAWYNARPSYFHPLGGYCFKVR